MVMLVAQPIHIWKVRLSIGHLNFVKEGHRPQKRTFIHWVFVYGSCWLENGHTAGKIGPLLCLASLRTIYDHVCQV